MVVLGAAARPHRHRRQFGVLRFTFGIPELSDGIGFVVVAMGMFGTAEIILNLELKDKPAGPHGKVEQPLSDPRRTEAVLGRRAARHRARLVLGILPGGGALLASFGAYTLEKKISKNPEKFGKGAIEGVAGAGVGEQRPAPRPLHPAC